MDTIVFLFVFIDGRAPFNISLKLFIQFKNKYIFIIIYLLFRSNILRLINKLKQQ